jgi:hypothetical protein
MKSNKPSLSLIDRAAFDGAGLCGELAGDMGKRARGEAARTEGRRRLCLWLAKHVASAMKPVCDGKFVIRRGVVLEHAPNTSNPTTWVDCLAASPFGVFVNNQYNWAGSLTRSTNHDELLVRDDFGVALVQTSPLQRRATCAGSSTCPRYSITRLSSVSASALSARPLRRAA